MMMTCFDIYYYGYLSYVTYKCVNRPIFDEN